MLIHHALPWKFKCTLLHDHSPKHTVRVIKNYFQWQKEQGVLQQMAWPPQSPDHNIMESVWDYTETEATEKGQRGRLSFKNWENFIIVSTLYRLFMSFAWPNMWLVSATEYSYFLHFQFRIWILQFKGSAWGMRAFKGLSLLITAGSENHFAWSSSFFFVKR